MVIYVIGGGRGNMQYNIYDNDNIRNVEMMDNAMG